MTDMLPTAVPDAEATALAWQRVQTARHPKRPRTLDLVRTIFTEFTELHGDRTFRDDPAVVGGPALLDGRPVMVIGHQKGSDTETNIFRNFGSPHPEGFRKAQRLMHLADKLQLPLITFLDTAGAFPGPAAEERGQAEAIASSVRLMTGLRVPIVTVILGEGGSGGALALGVGDRVLALENAVYAVISPEGCAAILWRVPEAAPAAAAAMRMTAADQLELGVVDEVIAEPGEGAHTDPLAAASAVKGALLRHLAVLDGLSTGELLTARYARLRGIGTVVDSGPRSPAPRRTTPTISSRIGRFLGRDETDVGWGDRYRGTDGEPAEDES